MRASWLAVIFTFSSFILATGQVAIGTNPSAPPSPDASAVLLLQGNGSQGLIVPIVTTLGAFGKQGMVVFNSTTNTMHYHNGTSWVTVGTGGGSNLIQISGNTITLGVGASSVNLATGFSNSARGFLYWNGTNWIQAQFTLPSTTQALVYDPATSTFGFQPLAAGGGIGTLSTSGTYLSVTNPTGPTTTITANPITNSDISNTAAIAGSKINPNFGAQNISTTGTVSTGGLTIGTSTWPANAAGVLTNNGSGTLTWSPAANLNLGGDLSGTAAAASVIRLQGQSVSATTPSAGQVLQYVSGVWTPANLTGGGTVTNVTATAPINVANGTTTPALTLNPLVDADISASAAIAGTKINPAFGAQNITTTTGSASIGGGLNVGLSNGLQISNSGNFTRINNIATSFPAAQGAANTYLRNDGAGNLSWATVAGGSDVTAQNGVLTGNGSTITGVASLPVNLGGTGATSLSGLVVGNGTSAFTAITTGTNGQVLTVTAGVPSWQNATTSGAAGGDLTGTYPAPTIASGAITSGKLATNAVGTANIANAAVDDSKIANVAPGKILQASATSGQVLKWNGSAWAPAADAVGGGGAPTLNPGQIIVGDGSTNSGATMSLDATLNSTNGNVTVQGFQGRPVSNAVPATNSVYQFNGTQWTPVVLAGGGTVSSIATGTGLTGGPITGTGTISIAPGGVTSTELAAGAVANSNIAANAVNTSQIVDGTITDADISGTAAIAVTKLATGTNGQVLTVNAGVPSWQNASGLTNPMTTAGDLIYGGVGGTPTRLAPGTGFLKGGATPTYSAVGLASTDVTGVLPIANGGTGAATAPLARTSLGLGSLATLSAVTSTEITDGTITDADISGTAAIAGSKINANFGAGNVATTGTLVVSGAVSLSNPSVQIGPVSYTWPGTQGAAGTVLTNNGTGTLSWGSTLTNPMTTPNDLIIGGAAGAATRLAAPGNNQVLTSNGSGAIAWAPQTSFMTNPLTTNGDIIYGVGSTPTRLAAGTGFLKGGAVPSYSAVSLATADVTGTLPVGNGGTGITTFGTGGLLYASGATTMGTIGNGTAGQMLLVTGTTPTWQTMGGDATITGTGSITIANSAITDVKVAAGAAIAGSKIAPNFGAQNVVTTGTLTTGTAGAFAVDATGNITKIRNVTTSFPAANAAGVLTNDGTGTLTWAAGSGWGLTGNSSTVDGTNFIGTTDNIPFTIRVNNQRAMRISFTGATSAPNILAGYSGNTISSGVVGSAILSGGFDVQINQVTDSYSVIGGGSLNQAGNNDADPNNAGAATVSGGNLNKATSGFATVGGGYNNQASGMSAVVAGGRNATASGEAAGVLSGEVNQATGFRSAVVGGNASTASGANSFVGGGEFNGASGNFSAVSGGGNNLASGDMTSIPGGRGLFARSFGETAVGLFNTDYTPASTTSFNASDRLFVIGNGTDFSTRSNALTVLKSGNVGIGTINPSEKLDLTGNLKFSGALMPNNLPGTAGQVLTSAGPGAPPTWGPAGSGWELTGNAGTNPATNFIGTTDAQPLRFATGVGGTERMRLDATGNLGFGIAAPLSKFHIKQSAQVNDVLTDAGSGFFGSGLMFENSGTTDSYYMGYGNGGYFRIGSKSAANVFTGMVYASPTGVGIFSPVPTEKLDVTGNIKFSGALMPNNLPGTAGQVLTSAGPGAPPTWGPAGSGWGLTGNAGTNPATNFIGTSDNQPITFKVNSQLAGLVGTFSNTFFGILAGSSISSGGGNTGFGNNAVKANTTGIYNVGVGDQALAINTTGQQNTAVGQGALSNNTGSYNTALGQAAMITNTSGTFNTAVGLYALDLNTTGNYSTAVGQSALFNNLGSANTAVGSAALSTNTTGTNNTAIGFQADVATPGLTNATAIGNFATVTASNTIQLGNASVTTVNVGTGTTAKLVAGQLQITGGTLGAGRVLTSDASGNATWQPASGGGWGLTGNAATVDGTNFIGTTDNIPLTLRVNNQRAGRIEGATPFATFYGYQAGLNNGAAQANTAIGYQALTGITSAGNTAIGYQTLQNTSGGQNTAVGSSALSSLSSGSGNTAVGQQALVNSTTTNFNTAVGLQTLFSSTGGSNAAFGAGAGQFNSSGQTNVFVGYQAGFPNATVANSNTTGSNNTFLGANTGLGSSTQRTNATAIGANARVDADNTIQLGDATLTTVNVGTGTTAKLVAGQLQITGGTLGAGRVLTSDAAGNATWQPAGGGGLISSSGSNTLTAGNSISTAGIDNAIFGNSAGAANTGNYNVFVGANAALSKTSGDLNTIMGWYAGNAANTAAGNTLIGAQSGESTTGSSNTFLGEKSGRLNTSGGVNTFIGQQTGLGNTTGFFNTAIGAFSNMGAAGLQNATAVGYRAQVSQNNSLVLGSINGVNGATASTNVGIGTATPTWPLTVSANNADYGIRLDQGSASGNGLLVYANTTSSAQTILSVQSNVVGLVVLGNGAAGLGRTPTTNQLEISGNASKAAAGGWLANSDRRIKTDVQEIENSLDIIKKLHPVKFKYTEEWLARNPLLKKGQFYYNYIAQEFKQVFPDAVQGSGEFLKGDKEEILQMDSYNAQIISIKAIQEQQKIIESQQAEIGLLRKELDQIKNYLGMEAKASKKKKRKREQ